MPVAPLQRLEPVLQNYAWGSRTVIARLQGRREPSSAPEAELWYGAHPTGDCVLPDGRTLGVAVTEAPLELLGAATMARFGPRLPFLLKILAVAAPLSLQVHPDAPRAAAGFAAENVRGLAPDSPGRRYRDPYAKPEIAVAVTTFHALAGVRDRAGALELLTALDVVGLRPYLAALRHGASVHEVVVTLLQSEADHDLVAAVGDAALGLSVGGGPQAASAHWIARLAKAYPGDTGVLCAVLLSHVELAPGEALVVPAGTLHAYLEGTAVELMGCSDNVLRGGLTPKFVDIPELLATLDPDSGPVPVVGASASGVQGECVYPTVVEDFRLSRLTPGAGACVLDHRGPQLILCLEGSATVVADGSCEPLSPGECVLVAAHARTVTVTGAGVLYRATPGLTA